ncbi:MAG: putative metal-binding motif-containing protein [Bacteroidetes bacterium]|nr:putative metal-binding motif-containing protein [Bacteroidota bacterium]
MNMKCTLLFVSLTALILMPAASNAQCPSGCNPLSGGYFISYVPQCYGENYQVTFQAAFEYAYDCNGGWWPWYTNNFTFSADFNTTYCATLYSTCYSSSPFQYCCDWDINNNCIQYCLDCNTSSYQIQQTTQVTTGSAPICNISVSATKTDASGFGLGCSPGSITVSASTNACNGWYAFIERLNDEFGPQTFSGYVDSSNPTLGGLQNGTYLITAYSNPGGCQATTSIIVGQNNCQMDVSTSVNNPLIAGCNNGEIKISAITNNCQGYQSTLMTTDSVTVTSCISVSGDTCSFLFLPPGNYLIKTTDYPYALSSCTRWNAITIADAPCVSPWTISATSASGYGCNDGSFTIRDTTTNCTNFSPVSIYQFTKQNYYTYLYLFNYIDKEFNYPGWPPGWYFFNATAGYTNYYGQYISCDIWDSIYIEPSCILTTSYFTSPASVTGCPNGEINVTATTNACSGYTADILSTTDSSTIFAQQTAASGVAINWNTVPPGNYLVRIRTNPFYDTLCEEIIPITIADAPCVSPWTISATSASGYGCYDGSFTIRDTTTNCTNFSTVSIYQFNKQNYYTYLYLANYPDKEFNYPGLPPGWYFFNATAGYTNYYGQYISCDIWDSIYIEPACILTATYSTSPASVAGCFNGEIKVTATTNACYGYSADILSTTDSSTIFAQQAAASGVELSWNTIPPGNYLLRIRTSPFYDTFCEEIIPFTIADAPCVSPWTISATSASGYGCYDGSFTIRDTTTNCTNFSTVSIYQFNKQNYYTYLYLANYPDKEFNYPGLPPGWYFFNATAGYTNYYGQYISCDIWDSVYIAPSCSIQTTYNIVSGCGVSILASTSITNSCNGHLANLSDSAGNLLYSIYNTSGVTTFFNNLIDGTYILTITSIPQGCQTTDTMQVTADIPNIYFADNDGDNFGNPALSTFACTAPIGYVTDSTDCDDTNPGVNPLASEINNGIDDNCNGNTDEFTSITLHLKIYIEGYYLGNGVMSAVLDPFTLPNICDSITVVLREPIAPFSPIHSTSSIIDINGNGVFNFPAAVNNQLYYIEVINRNTIATWSKLPILFDSPVLNYDFTD